MESGKSKSHSNLLSTRGASSTDLLPRTQSLHSKYGLYNAGAGNSPSSLPSIPSRPGSSVRTNALRPFSARPLSSRPGSRAGQSRSPSRINSSRSPTTVMRQSRQQSSGTSQRPASAIRPLSSRVFMRRMDHGWVAKHYPDNNPSSHPNDDDFDDLSDCESLDSFFNEEFDVREESEKLGDLLSCNTLGVESKGHKRDWNSGEVGIPKFHCPRCRDHWYGFTPFPCDEELARLIREGLWYTGNKEAAKPRNDHSKERSGTVNATSNARCSPIMKGANCKTPNEQRSLQIPVGKGDGHQDPTLGRGRNDGKKSKRRITFKLDDHNDDGSGEMNGKIMEKCSSTNALGESRSENETVTVRRENEHQISSVNDINGSGSVDKSSSNIGLHAITDTTATKDGLNSQDTDLESSGHNKSRGKRGMDRKTGTMSSKYDVLASQKASKSGSISREGVGASDDVGMGLANALANDQTKHKGMKNGTLENSAMMINETDTLGNNSSEKARLDMDGKRSGLESALKQASQSSMLSSHSRSTLLETGGPDYGKKVRKPGGYMRASSPTGSEWDDPAHARPFASSTAASSHSGSTSNLLKDKLPSSLPPIKHKRKPVADFYECGFEITPPWRFSYFSPSPIRPAKPTPRTVATNTRRKT